MGTEPWDKLILYWVTVEGPRLVYPVADRPLHKNSEKTCEKNCPIQVFTVSSTLCTSRMFKQNHKTSVQDNVLYRFSPIPFLPLRKN